MDNAYDLIIVGGGAAGMMAAVSAKRHNPDLKVCVVDRTFALGRKILVCGAGRCNITNVNLNESIEKHYYGAPTGFISSIFTQFGYEDIVKFFNDLGVELYIERKTDIGKLFPVTNQAQTIADMLLDEMNRLGIEIRLLTEVQKLEKQQDRFTLNIAKLDPKGNVDDVSTLTSTYVIMSAGGKTYPALGSNGTGYNLLEHLGHHIVTPVPSALPLEAKSQYSHFLQGVKLDCEVTSIIDGKPIKMTMDEVMFTQYGLSGPAILNISREISIRFHREQKTDVQVKLNFVPGFDRHTVEPMLEARWNKRPNQTVEKSLIGLFLTKFPPVFLQQVGVDPNTTVSSLTPEQKVAIYDGLTSTIVEITNTRGWNEAEFTAGGVDSNELNPGTLESKLVPNLYICGEIIDVDGDVGGFNLSWSWASGFVVGKLGSI